MRFNQTHQIGVDNSIGNRIKLIIVNMRVHEDDILCSIIGRPNRSMARLKNLIRLLNQVAKEKCDLLVLPEMSIPRAWIPLIQSYSRKHMICVIFGAEYFIHQLNGFSYAHNQMFSVLPYKINQYTKCVTFQRTKRHYSPNEIKLITGHHLLVPDNVNIKYDLFKWRGVTFTVFNCYEIAAIDERASFKGKVDLFICSEWNKDINYFSNIIESVSRDIHCFAIQVNTSQYGDSRVISPSSSEIMNILRVKGGDNTTYLATILNLDKLRKHQNVAYNLQMDSRDFKCTPPGWEYRDVQDRINYSRVEDHPNE